MDYKLKNKLVNVLDDRRVDDKTETVRTYASSLNGSIVEPKCVVFPETSEEVAELVRLANREQLQLYPISRGKNWGYGSAQGTAPQQVIVDLSRMDKIIRVDEQMCYMSLQPGVTQGQTYAYLQATKSRLQLDATGAGPGTSIVGNVLERGFGHTDYGDRFSKIINLTIVLPTGRIIKTGFGAYANADAADVYRPGVGPAIDGIFSQSNLGIITEMTIELMPKPEKFCMFVITSNSTNALPNMVEAIRELKLNGTVNSAVHMANKARAVGEFECDSLGEWALSGSVSGPAPLVRARKKVIRQVFKKYLPKSTVWFITDGLIRVLDWIDQKVVKLGVYRDVKFVAELQKGIPSNKPLEILTGNPKATDNLNPSSLPLNFRWICATCKAEAGSVNKLSKLLTDKFEKFSFEYRVTFTAINPRCLIMISNICYPKTPAAIAEASAFYGDCIEALSQEGFYSYRNGSGRYQSMLPYADANHINFLNALKSAIDPNNVLAPGKYNMTANPAPQEVRVPTSMLRKQPKPATSTETKGEVAPGPGQ